MFFTQEGEVAHIWCAEASNPLFLVKAEEFPLVWPRLDVGSVVVADFVDDGTRQVVQRLELLEDEAR